MRVAFVGDVAAGRPILEVIGRDGRLAAIAASGQRHRRMAADYGVEVLDAASINERGSVARLRSLAIDLVVNFNATVLFSDALLACPRIGAINFHPGLLPEYAGLNVHQWAMLNGEATTGATIHVIAGGVDEGPVLVRTAVAIDDDDTGLTLYMKLLRSGAEAMAGVLDRVARDGLAGAEPQDLSRRHLYRRRDRPCGRVDFSRPIARVRRFVRALTYRPMTSPLGTPWIDAPRGRLEPLDLLRTGRPTPPGTAPGTVLSVDADGLAIACADEIATIPRALVGDTRLSAVDAAARLDISAGTVV